VRFSLVQRLLGLYLLGYSVTLVPPILVSLLYQDDETPHFLNSLILCLALGAVLYWPVRHQQRELRIRDGFTVVATFWVALSILSAIPFLFSPHLSFADALFESVSGFTTTGATVIVGLDSLPKSVLYYRQQLQWLGGMGVIVLAVAISPMLGVGGMQLYRAETPGPMKYEKLTPRIAQTARSLWTIYIGLTVACALSYWWAGMSLFDAVAHSFSTISTGGFSTHDASIGYFREPFVEVVAAIFMVLGAINFSVHFFALRRRYFQFYLIDDEVRTLLLFILCVALIIGGLLFARNYYPSLGEALQHAGFHTISVITSTGFTTTGFSAWPSFAPVLLIFLSFVGGCGGSTAGGMKVVRWLLIYKQGAREVFSLIHPRAQSTIKLNSRPLPDRVLNSVWGFFSVYIITFAILMLLLMATGVDQITAFSAMATCMNNLGPGLGDVSANFVTFDRAGILISCIAMLLGRLEIFTFLVLANPGFWRN
jgi:trk system potassium uptake protein TrkH